MLSPPQTVKHSAPCSLRPSQINIGRSAAVASNETPDSSSPAESTNDGRMTPKEIVDAFLKFLGIILAWPIVVLIVILLAREQLPGAFTELSHRITEGPLGFKFSEIDQKL